MKRFLTLVLSLALILSVTASLPAHAQEKIELAVWHIWPDTTGEGDRRSIDEYAKLFEAEHPGVTIVQDASDTESYKNKLRVSFAGGELPDVYFTYGAGFSLPFVQTGRVKQLDDGSLPQETLDRMMPGAEANYIYDGKLYGLPVKTWAGTFFVNKELFEKEGIQIPETFAQLMDVIKAFRDKGYQPLCAGGKDAWHLAMYFDQVALRAAGVEGVQAAMNGQKKFNDPEFLRAAEIFDSLVKANAFNDGFMALGAQEAQAEFLMGRIPMYFNGSWMTGDIQDPENQVADKILALPMPAIDENDDRSLYSGGAIDGWSVSADSKHLDLALAFCAGLAEYQSIASYKSGDGISVWLSDVDESEINPVLTQINNNLTKATGYFLAWDTNLAGADINFYLTTLQDLASGAKTPQEFVDALQEGLSVAMK